MAVQMGRERGRERALQMAVCKVAVAVVEETCYSYGKRHSEVVTVVLPIIVSFLDKADFNDAQALCSAQFTLMQAVQMAVRKEQRGAFEGLQTHGNWLQQPHSFEHALVLGKGSLHGEDSERAVIMQQGRRLPNSAMLFNATNTMCSSKLMRVDSNPYVGYVGCASDTKPSQLCAISAPITQSAARIDTQYKHFNAKSTLDVETTLDYPYKPKQPHYMWPFDPESDNKYLAKVSQCVYKPTDSIWNADNDSPLQQLDDKKLLAHLAQQEPLDITRVSVQGVAGKPGMCLQIKQRPLALPPLLKGKNGLSYHAIKLTSSKRAMQLSRFSRMSNHFDPNEFSWEDQHGQLWALTAQPDDNDPRTHWPAANAAGHPLRALLSTQYMATGAGVQKAILVQSKRHRIATGAIDTGTECQYVASNNETPAKIAKKMGIDLAHLLKFNAHLYTRPKLKATSKLEEGTILYYLQERTSMASKHQPQQQQGPLPQQSTVTTADLSSLDDYGLGSGNGLQDYDQVIAAPEQLQGSGMFDVTGLASGQEPFLVPGQDLVSMWE